MTIITKLVSFALFLNALVSVTAYAATYTAASCNEADVQAAYTSEQASAQDGDIISIPAGTCTWTSLWTISPANSLTIQGAGAKSATDGGTSTTGTDQTILNVPVNPDQWLTFTTATNKTYRITGLTIIEAYGNSNPSNGAITLLGTSAAFRMDHNHFVTYSQGYHMVNVHDAVLGVADHNVFELPLGIPIAVENGRAWNGETTSHGDKSWADAAYWGSNKFFFVEDNYFKNLGGTGLYGNDCSTGGRQVFRYNTFYGQGTIQQHEALGSYRGCREGEVYGNSFLPFLAWQPSTVYVNPSGGASTGQRITDPAGHIQQITTGNCTSGTTTPSWSDSGGTTSDGTCTWADRNAYFSGSNASSRSGSVLMWGNTIQHTQAVFNPSIDRIYGVNGTFVPNSYGMCGNGDTHNGFVGIVSTNGTAVTLVSGNNTWGSNIQFPNTSPQGWPSESDPYIYINGVQYTVSFIASTTSLTLTTSAGTQTNVAYYVPSVWDGNIDTTGYPCLDMPGRGQGDLVVGEFTSGNRVDQSRGKPTWPHEILDPIYVWGNTVTWWSGTSVVNPGNFNVYQDNRDYYQQMGVYCNNPPYNACGENPNNITLSSGQSVPFDGTHGIGQGPLSARPSTCTAGTDPATGGSAPGVGYWATDAVNPQDANHPGVLYVCNPTNTWSAYYTPYTYPHPLTQGDPPNPPSGLSATVQ